MKNQMIDTPIHIMYISCEFSLDFSPADYGGSSGLALLYTLIAVFTLLTFRQPLLIAIFFI